MTCNHLETFDVMPVGWKFDDTWGSPLPHYTPISNGKSILKGGKKGLLKIKNNQSTQSISKSTQSINHVKNNKNKNNVFPAQKINDLARLRAKEQLLKDIAVDLSICKLEGWDHKEYISDLKNTIDDIYKKIACKRVEDAYKQGDLFGYDMVSK